MITGRLVVAVKTREVRGHTHVTMVRLDDETLVPAKEVVRHIDTKVYLYSMIPPKGAPAREAYVATGAPLVLQTRTCPDCRERVIWA